MGILEFRDSVTFPAFSGEFSQQHLPFRVAPALVFVEIVGQLPRERAAVEVEISRFVHAVQLSGQIVLVVVALAAVRQRPVEGAVGVHSLGPDAEYKGRRLAVAVLLHPDVPFVYASFLFYVCLFCNIHTAWFLCSLFFVIL